MQPSSQNTVFDSSPLAHLVMKPSSIPRLLLIDDDPVFGKIMQRVARNLGAPLTYVQSVSKMPEVRADVFDVAIVDYDLGSVTGLELMACLENQGLSIPVVLVSEARRSYAAHWSDIIHE